MAQRKRMKRKLFVRVNEIVDQKTHIIRRLKKFRTYNIQEQHQLQQQKKRNTRRIIFISSDCNSNGIFTPMSCSCTELRFIARICMRVLWCSLNECEWMNNDEQRIALRPRRISHASCIRRTNLMQFSTSFSSGFCNLSLFHWFVFHSHSLFTQGAKTREKLNFTSNPHKIVISLDSILCEEHGRRSFFVSYTWMKLRLCIHCCPIIMNENGWQRTRINSRWRRTTKNITKNRRNQNNK